MIKDILLKGYMTTLLFAKKNMKQAAHLLSLNIYTFHLQLGIRFFNGVWLDSHSSLWWMSQP